MLFTLHSHQAVAMSVFAICAVAFGVSFPFAWIVNFINNLEL